MSIALNLRKIKSGIPKSVKLIAVTKTKTLSQIIEAYIVGQRIFGENRIQEMTEKWQALPSDIQWHMIGHVQRNKVKYMAEYVSLIHGVDSLSLLQEINKQAIKHNRVIDCLLQIHIAEEDTKFGLNTLELLELLDSESFKSLKNVKIIGLMGMATFTDDTDQVNKEFAYLNTLFLEMKDKFGTTDNLDLKELSMGMSGDYKIAINNGSTMVRIGSSIFGSRN